MGIILPPRTKRGGYTKVGGIWSKASGISDSGLAEPIVVVAAGGNVTFDNVGSGEFTSAGIPGDNKVTFNLVVNSTLTNGCILIFGALGAPAAITLNTVTPTIDLDATNVTLVGSVQGVGSGGTGNGHLAVWRFISSSISAGTKSIVITGSDTELGGSGFNLMGYAMSFSNVNQTTPITSVQQTGNSGTTAVTSSVTTTTGGKLIGVANYGNKINGAGFPATNRASFDTNTSSGGGTSGVSERNGTGSGDTMSFSINSDSWASIAFSLDKA